MLGALVAAAALLRLLVALQVAAGPVPRLHALWEETDNHFFDLWGKRIAAGDLLQPEPFHPMPSWMRQVAGRALAEDPGLPARLGLAPGPGEDAGRVADRLWDRWLGGATWFQEPGYPYLVGLTYRLAGPEPWAVLAWQLALGVAGVLLAHALARRVSGSDTAAAAAGALAVLAPVPLYLELALLRDAPVAVATLGLAWLAAWAVEGGRRRYLLLGLAFGAAALLKQTFLAFPVLMAAWRLASHRAAWRDRLGAAGLAAGGMALALLPAVLRNAAVGVPLLAFNGSAGAQLPVFHTAGAPMFAIAASDAYPGILARSGGRPLRALLEAAATHESPWRMAVLEARKLLWTWHAYEAPNNADFYLVRQAAPALAWLPARLPLLAPLAAAGLVAAGRRAWPVVLAALVGLAGVVLSTALSRYRAPVVAALLPLAGVGAARLAAWAADRRWRPLGAAALLAAGYAAWATAAPPVLTAQNRAARYLRAGEAFAPVSPALAALHLQEALRLVPGDREVERRLAHLLLEAGDLEGALDRLGRAGWADGERLRRAGQLAAGGRRVEAAAEARAAAGAPGGSPGREGGGP